MLISLDEMNEKYYFSFFFFLYYYILLCLKQYRQGIYNLLSVFLSFVFYYHFYNESVSMPEPDRQKLNMQSSILWNSNSQILVPEKKQRHLLKLQNFSSNHSNFNKSLKGPINQHNKQLIQVISIQVVI